eukprot:ANDGO_08489.mRNA.2 Myosin heavy chain kinase B
MGALDAVNSLCIVGNLFYAGSFDGSIHAYDLESGSLVLNLKGHTASVCCLAERGGMLFSASDDATIRVWSVYSAECTQVLTTHKSAVTAMVLTDRHLISGDRDHEVHIHDISKAPFPFVKKVDNAHLSQISAIYALSAHGDILTGSYDRLVKRINWNSGAMVSAYVSGKSKFGPGHTIRCVVADENSKRIFVGSSDARIRVYNLETADCVLEMKTDSSVFCLAFWKGQLYAGCEDGSVRQYSAEKGTLDYTFKGHTDSVTSLCLSEDGLLVTGSYDRSVRCWDLNGTLRFLQIMEEKKAEEERMRREREAEASRLSMESAASKKSKKKKK